MEINKSDTTIESRKTPRWKKRRKEESKHLGNSHVLSHELNESPDDCSNLETDLTNSSEVDNDSPEITERCTREILSIVNSMVESQKERQFVTKRVMNDLKNVLHSLDQVCDIVPFGSSVNGLVCQGSDFDLFLRTPVKDKSRDQIKSLLNQTAKKLDRSNAFCEVFRIRRARIPIVKFLHKSTRSRCDLSFTNEIGVRNTLLIQYYLSMNDNLKPLVLFLKHLLKLYDLHGTQKITTFMLFWLVAYYMQQSDLLPPVQTVRELVKEPYIINGWDCRVPEPYSTPVTDRFSLFFHAKKFLQFYSKFQFSKFVVSPYLACNLPIDKLESFQIPQDLFDTYLQKVQDVSDTTFNFSAMNLQDPIALNVNITRQIELSSLNKFKLFCSYFYIFFNTELKTKILQHETLTEILPKTLPNNVPRSCSQCFIQNILPSRLPKEHPILETFAENGFSFFAKQLESVLQSKYDCEVLVNISEETLRITLRDGTLQKKVVPVAYFDCVCRKKCFCEKGTESNLFILMNTSSNGNELRFHFEGTFALLCSMRKNIVKLLTEV